MFQVTLVMMSAMCRPTFSFGDAFPAVLGVWVNTQYGGVQVFSFPLFVYLRPFCHNTLSSTTTIISTLTILSFFERRDRTFLHCRQH